MNKQKHTESLSSQPSATVEQELGQPSIASASTFRKDSSKSTGSKDRFTKEDFDRVLSWLEHQPNFELIHGVSGQTSVGKPTRTASSGYATLAALISRQSKGRLQLTGRAMRERFQRHKNKYKSVKEQSSRTGFGVTEDDRKNGIYTVAGKLESLCTCYQRMDDLYGQKPNINPLAELSLAKTDKSRGFSYEEGLDLDIDALDDTFDGNSNDGDNDGDNDSDNDGDSDNHKERDDNNSNGGLRLRARDLDSVDINNVDDILDGIHESAFTDDADQDHVGEPDIIEVPPTTNPASSQQAARSRSSKRRSSDTESNVSRKSRATDTRKAPPKLDHGPTQTSRNGFANVYMESSVSKLEGTELDCHIQF